VFLQIDLFLFYVHRETQSRLLRHLQYVVCILQNSVPIPKTNKQFERIIHTYHSRFIREGVAETSQIFLRDTPRFNLNYLAMSNTADVTGGKPIAV
jgi:hypothetical protein